MSHVTESLHHRAISLWCVWQQCNTWIGVAPHALVVHEGEQDEADKAHDVECVEDLQANQHGPEGIGDCVVMARPITKQKLPFWYYSLLYYYLFIVGTIIYYIIIVGTIIY